MLAAPGVALLASLALAAPSWHDPVLPFGDVPARSGDAGMAMGPDGTTIVARFSPDSALEVRERPPGGAFGATVTLPHVLISPEPEPHMQVLAGDNGTAAILYDAGTVRYATLRPPGRTWTRAQVLAPAGTTEAGIGQDGAVWAAGADPGVEGGLALFRLAAGGHPERRPLPAPPDGATDRFPSLVLPYLGGVRVAYVERTVAGCTVIDRLRVADSHGEPDTLATTQATGPAGDVCHPGAGELLGAPELATDAAGDDTVAFPVLDLTRSTVKTLARHRDYGGDWGADEIVSDGNVVPDQLLGGRGAPVAVLRSGAGRFVATRGAGGVWTPPAPLSDVVASFAAARTGAGGAVFAWVTDTQAVAGLLGTMGDPQPLGPAGEDATLLGAGGDAAGDAAVLFSTPAGDAYRLELAGSAGAPAPPPPPAAVAVAATPPAAVIAPPSGQTPILTGVQITPRHPRAGRRITLHLRTDQPGELQVTLARGETREHVRGRLRTGRNTFALPRLKPGLWRATVTEITVDRHGRSSAFLRFQVRPAARRRP